MNAIEKDLIAWAKAKVRWQEWTLASGEARTRLLPELTDRRSGLMRTELALYRRGMRLLRKEGKADAR